MLYHAPNPGTQSLGSCISSRYRGIYHVLRSLYLFLAYISAFIEGSLQRKQVSPGEIHSAQHVKHSISSILLAFHDFGRSLYPWEYFLLSIVPKWRPLSQGEQLVLHSLHAEAATRSFDTRTNAWSECMVAPIPSLDDWLSRSWIPGSKKLLKRAHEE